MFDAKTAMNKIETIVTTLPFLYIHTYSSVKLRIGKIVFLKLIVHFIRFLQKMNEKQAVKRNREVFLVTMNFSN